RANDPAIELSGGERRRVAIARAMYRRASIIFADEPTASLDEHNRSVVQDLLLAEAQRASTVVIATHDLTLASACDKAIQLPSR
ncbi:MAG: ATP-binding cassette domain-containing protein, partial [Propionibacteriaceae bacterium]|nr:ATP-binding cassette domain-containing protein [Propionibacteriaceae bacterium]